nr:MAG TPA: hypothetical protein [Caudoviricetes sp.]
MKCKSYGRSDCRIFGVNMIIHSGIDAYLLLLLSMWPVLIVLCIGMSLAFYGVLMRKTAITFIVIAIITGVLGWFYT